MKKYGNPKLDKPYKSNDQLKFLAALNHDQPELDRLDEEDRKERLEKLKLLCLHYNIKPTKFVFYELSLALAKDFVKGFQEENPRGAKNKWDYVTEMEFMEEAEKHIDPGNPSKGVSYAMKTLIKKEPWKSFVSSKDSSDTSPNPAEALRKVYYRCKKQKEKNRISMRKLISEQFPELVKNLKQN